MVEKAGHDGPESGPSGIQFVAGSRYDSSLHESVLLTPD
jgi:hypothetical protein